MYANNELLSAQRIAQPAKWRAIVVRAIRDARGHLSQAATALGISRATMSRYCRELGLPHGTAGRKKVVRGA